MDNKHLVNIALAHIGNQKGKNLTLDELHAQVIRVGDKLFETSVEVDSLPAVIEQRANLAEELSKAYADGKVSEEEARRIADVLQAIKEAKGYTNTAKAGTEEYINSIKTEVIDYSDTLLHNLEGALGPLAWEDKVELARLGQTIIDGGYLKTELIKAHSIGAEKINTNELVVGHNIQIGEDTLDVLEQRSVLAETVSKAYADGKVSEEEARRIADVLQAIKEAKGYTDVAKIGTEEYINSIKTEVIDYSDTLLHNLESSLGPLAWEDKVELARLGQTIIDGGYLKTELIKAHSIGADKINTNELVVGSNIGIGESIPLLIEERSALAETVSKAYADGVVDAEEARSIQATLDALNTAKGYTDTSEANTKSYADGKLIESIDYSDTLISQLESSLGPLAWGDKVELARLGSTVIDGGYLKTELIKANSIGAGKINTDELVVGDNITLGPNAIIEWSNLAPETKVNLKGEDGAKGDKGDRGPKGDKGNTGAKGATGERGPQGAIGTSVSGVTEYYQVSTSKTTAPTTWLTTMPNMTATNKYLWNYEKINFSDGDSQNTIPVVVGAYGDTGNTGSTGQTGATGRSITGITEYYLATSAATGVTRSTSGWKTTMQTTTPTNKYLWNYEKITWSSGTITTYVEPIIIGIHGATGAKGDKGDKGDKGNTGARGPQGVIGPQGPQGIKGDTGARGSIGPTGTTGPQGTTGRGISEVRTQYYLSTSKTTRTGGVWDYVAPTWSPGKYVWTRSVITYTNPTEEATTTAMVDSSWEASMVSSVGGEAKKFINPTSISVNTSGVTGYLIVKTPIMTSRMLTFKLSGYNYVTNNSIIDVSASFYHYSTGVLQHSFQSFGSYKINEVRAARDSSGRAVLIIGTASSTWSYPKISVDEVMVGYQTSPDSYISGWSMEFSTNISAYSNVQLLNGYDAKDSLDKSVKSVTVQYNLSTSHTSANGSWVNTAPAYIQDRYMWTRTVTVLNDGTTTYAPTSAGVLIAGAIPNYITSTKITSTTIEAPTISGTTGRFAGTVFVGAAGNTAGITGVGSSNSSVRFWAGSSSSATAPFRVTQDGSVVMTKANIETESTGGLYVKMSGSKVEGGNHTLGKSYTLGTANLTGSLRSGILQLDGYSGASTSTITRTMQMTSNTVMVSGSNLVLGGADVSVPTVITRTVRDNSHTMLVPTDIALITQDGGAMFNGPIYAQEGGNVPTLEEGTFTPVLVKANGSTRDDSPIYYEQIGKYFKIGNNIYIRVVLRFRYGDIYTTGLAVGGLPFTIHSNNLYDMTPFAVEYYSGFNENPLNVFAYHNKESSAIKLFSYIGGKSNISGSLIASNKTGLFTLNGWYTTI